MEKDLLLLLALLKAKDMELWKNTLELFSHESTTAIVNFMLQFQNIPVVYDLQQLEIFSSAFEVADVPKEVQQKVVTSLMFGKVTQQIWSKLPSIQNILISSSLHIQSPNIKELIDSLQLFDIVRMVLIAERLGLQDEAAHLRKKAFTNCRYPFDIQYLNAAKIQTMQLFCFRAHRWKYKVRSLWTFTGVA